MRHEEHNEIIEKAALACEATCGKWNVKKNKSTGEREANCPCAEAVRKLKIKPLKSGVSP